MLIFFMTCCRETIPEYMSGMSELSNGMLKLIMYSLGENVGKQYGSCVFDEKLRFNFYPKVAEASSMYTHTFMSANAFCSHILLL